MHVNVVMQVRCCGRSRLQLGMWNLGMVVAIQIGKRSCLAPLSKEVCVDSKELTFYQLGIFHDWVGPFTTTLMMPTR